MIKRTQFLTSLLSIAFFSLALNANENDNENINGFTAKQSDVVYKAFDILTQQNWDQLTDENLTTLSQAAAIAMDSRNEHYSPKAAFSFMTRILEVQYDYKPLNELTQKVFKSAILSVMRGDYRFASERERVLRNPYEFHSDLRQMREMLKRAKLVEQRKANECLFVNTLGPVLGSMSKEHIDRFKSGRSCSEAPTDLRAWCQRSYNGQEHCNQGLSAIIGDAGCLKSQSALLQAVLNPPPCANPVEIAAKLNTDAPFVSVEQIEKTLNNEDTELAFNMGLAVTDPASQRTYHLIRDGFQPNAPKANSQELVEDDEEFDIDGSFSMKQPVQKMLQLAATAKSRVQQLADFATTMDGARYKTVSDVWANKPLLLGTGSDPKKAGECSEPSCGTDSQTESKTESKTAEPEAAPGIWNRLMKLFGR